MQIDDYLPQEAHVAVLPEERGLFWQKHPHTYQVLWKSDFLIYDDTSLLARPLEVMMQVARGPEYWCDCKFRENSHIRYFCYTLSGTGGFRDRTGIYSLPAGHGFLVETDDPHASYFYPPEAKEPWRYLAFTFHGLQAHVMVRAILRQYGPVFQLPPESPIISRLLRFRIADYSHGQIHLTQMQLFEGVQLVGDLLAALMESRRPSEQDHPGYDLVQQAISMIVSQKDGSLRVNDVAQALGVSREHLSRLFQRRLGKSLRTFMLEQKMRRACILLKETDMPMKSISNILGYTAYSNFALAFEQMVRMTPRHFRMHGHTEASFDFSAPEVEDEQL